MDSVLRIQEKPTGSTREAKRQKGFSLIELLIVVAVILIIAGMAIPNFIRSKMRANEAAAVQNLRNMDTAEVVYATTYGVGFAPSLTTLGGTGTTVDKNSAQLIDEVLASGKKTGYSYTYKALARDPAGNVISYSINADPLIVGSTGVRHFYTDQTAVIRVNQTSSAGPSDPPV